MCDQMTASHRSAVRRDFVGRESITNVECGLEHRFHVPWPAGPWMSLEDLATPTDQMRETGLMAGFLELPIRRPSIAHQDAAIIGAKDRRRFVKAPALLNRIHDGGRG